ncbi:MAG: hypothetical protein NXI02_28655 [Rhodobacteraceae bacterium]|nr:hypothetical protein [Paracoccaceae bacterium]
MAKTGRTSAKSFRLWKPERRSAAAGSGSNVLDAINAAGYFTEAQSSGAANAMA